MSKMFLFGQNGLQQVNDAPLSVGSVIWLNGYGQSKYGHDDKAIYKIVDRLAYWVNLNKPERGQCELYAIRPENEIFGIGLYYTPGQTATPEQITDALQAAINEEKNKEAVKAAISVAFDEFMKPWGDIKNLPSGTINRTWFKNAMRAGKLLVKCTGKYTDDYAFDAAYNFGKDDFYQDCPPDYFNDWKMSVIRIWGNKNGNIDVSFASSEHYDFLVKPEYLDNAPKIVEPVIQPNAALYIVDYSEKAIAVFGDTKAIKETLKSMGGRFNPALTHNGEKLAGWVFSKSKESDVKSYISTIG